MNEAKTICSTWLFFYEGEKDKPQFKVRANTQCEAYHIAEETHGTQVEDMMYCKISKENETDDTLLFAGIMDVLKAWDKIAYDDYWLGYGSLSDSLQEKGFRQYSEDELKKHMQIMKKKGFVESKPLTDPDSNRLYGRGWFACSN